MADLHQIYEALGGIRARVDTMADEQDRARDRDEKIFKKLEELGTSTALTVLHHKQLESRVAVMEPEVESYKKVKQRGIALWILSVAGVGFASQLATVVKWFGKGS